MGSSESKAKSSEAPGCMRFGKAGGAKCEFSLATLGLDNAGKTSIVLSLSKEPVQDVMPTVGFDSKKITLHGRPVTLFDLGGGPKIRGIWKNYLAEVHGIVYVVDASDTARIEESAKEFRSLCRNTFVHGKPMLILANKSDMTTALSEYELTEMMDLEEIVNINKIPTKIQASTTKPQNHKTLKDGMEWLYMSIMSDWETLEERVKQDTHDANEKKKAERRERMERIRRDRDERDLAEGVVPETEESQGAGNVPDGANPFQSLKDHLTTKDAEEQMHKTTNKKGSHKQRPPPRPPRSKLPESTNSQHISNETSGDMAPELPERVMPHILNGQSGNITQDHLNNHHSSMTQDDSITAEPAQRNGNIDVTRRTERVPSPLPTSFKDGLGSMSARLPPLGGTLPPLSASSLLKPIDSITDEVTTKKKKKRKKKTRISPTNLDTDYTNGLMPVEEEAS